MIIEGILTTVDEDGTARVSPMGAVLSEAQKRFELRPFASSNSFQNLLRRPQGVFHLTDDALLFAQAVTKRWSASPNLAAARTIPGWIIRKTYRWFEFEAVYVDRSLNRAMVQCLILDQDIGLPFAGTSRAKNAIIEACVAVSRVHLLPPEEIEAALSKAEGICQKAGGAQEIQALQILKDHVSCCRPESSPIEKNEMLPFVESRTDPNSNQ